MCLSASTSRPRDTCPYNISEIRACAFLILCATASPHESFLAHGRTDLLRVALHLTHASHSCSDCAIPSFGSPTVKNKIDLVDGRFGRSVCVHAILSIPLFRSRLFCGVVIAERAKGTCGFSIDTMHLASRGNRHGSESSPSVYANIM